MTEPDNNLKRALNDPLANSPTNEEKEFYLNFSDVLHDSLLQPADGNKIEDRYDSNTTHIHSQPTTLISANDKSSVAKATRKRWGRHVRGKKTLLISSSIGVFLSVAIVMVLTATGQLTLLDTSNAFISDLGAKSIEHRASSC